MAKKKKAPTRSAGEETVTVPEPLETPERKKGTHHPAPPRVERRTTFDQVGDAAPPSVKLKLRQDGYVYVYHNGELILKDGPKDYTEALDQVRTIARSEQ